MARTISNGLNLLFLAKYSSKYFINARWHCWYLRGKKAYNIVRSTEYRDLETLF